MGGELGKKEEEERLMLLEEEGGVSVLDFDVLCSNVAMQSNKGGQWRMWDYQEYEDEDVESGEFSNGGNGGVLRMWEGQLVDCFHHPSIALQSFFCPCYRFGKNMGHAGLGSCFIQGTIYFLVAISALLNCVAFIMTRRSCFLYIAVGFSISLGLYVGFCRTQMRNKLNIQGSHSDRSLDDCVYHLLCPCCTLSQESRTLEMNNVEGGTWHGRGDTLCVGTLNGRLRPPLPIEINTVPKQVNININS